MVRDKHTETNRVAARQALSMPSSIFRRPFVVAVQSRRHEVARIEHDQDIVEERRVLGDADNEIEAQSYSGRLVSLRTVSRLNTVCTTATLFP